MTKPEIAPRIDNPRSLLLRRYGLALAAVFLSFIALSLGWKLFMLRIVDRTALAESATSEVAKIWGGPLQQPQPEVRWRRTDAATVDLVRGDIKKTKIDVDLDASYRKRGMTEYPAYKAKFSGTYAFENPSPGPVFVAFSIGLPVERSALMLTDLTLLVNGEEDEKNTQYGADRVVWTGEVKSAESARFTLRYSGRGLERFGYSLANPQTIRKDSDPDATFRPISNFELTMAVRGVKGQLDYPTGAMTPTAMTVADGEQRLHWKVNRLLSAFDVGVVLPDRSGTNRAIQRLINHAPWYYLMFAFGLLYGLTRMNRWAMALHVCGISAAYFLYFPLTTYLAVYLPWSLATGIALIAIGGLVVAHTMRFVGGYAARWIGLALVFFLATPGVAYLIPSKGTGGPTPGLILVVVGFVVLAVLLHGVGLAARNFKEEISEAPLPTESEA